MAERLTQPAETSHGSEAPPSGHSAWKIFVLPNTKAYRVIKRSAGSQHFPSFVKYIQHVENVLDQNGLAQHERTMARAFATAVYRRALARKLLVDAEAVVVEAITRARLRLSKGEPQKVKKSTYAYQSESSGRTRSGRRREPGHGRVGEG
jgi:hypothetical protein